MYCAPVSCEPELSTVFALSVTEIPYQYSLSSSPSDRVACFPCHTQSHINHAAGSQQTISSYTCLFRMDSGDESVLRARCRAIPKMPIFPDLHTSLDDEGSQTEHQENGDNQLKNNGKSHKL